MVEYKYPLKPKYPRPTIEQLEKDVKSLEIDISRYNELNKTEGLKGNFSDTIRYFEGSRNALLYAIGYFKEIR